MVNLQHILADFGRDLGIPELTPGSDGAVQLRFDSGALLGVAAKDYTVVLHLAEPLAAVDAARMAFAAMRQAGDAKSAAMPVQAGLRSTSLGDWLVMATRLPADCDARGLARAVEHLQQWYATLEVR